MNRGILSSRVICLTLAAACQDLPPPQPAVPQASGVEVASGGNISLSLLEASRWSQADAVDFFALDGSTPGQRCSSLVMQNIETAPWRTQPTSPKVRKCARNLSSVEWRAGVVPEGYKAFLAMAVKLEPGRSCSEDQIQGAGDVQALGVACEEAEINYGDDLQVSLQLFPYRAPNP